MAEWLEEPAEVRGQLSKLRYLDGSYELTLPPTLSHPVPFTDRSGITWEYDVQERLGGPDSPRERASRVWRDERESARLSLRDNLAGTVSVDRFGRRWRPVSINSASLAARIAAYDEENGGGERGLRAPADRTERPPPFVGWVRPDVLLDDRTGYSGIDCNGDGTDDEYTWGHENRTRANPMDSRDAKTVYLRFLHSGGGRDRSFCSGTLVDANTVLTAAHCLYTSRGKQRDFSGSDANSVGVACTRENLQAGAECATIARISRPGGYDPDSSPIEYDYGLVHLDDNLGAGNFMAISRASAATHTAAAHESTGTPLYSPYAIVDGGCRFNLYWKDSDIENPAFPGMHAYTQRVNDDTTWLEVGGIFDAASWYATQADAGGGQSGSAMWYYPSASSSSHYITMVVSRYRSWWFDGYLGGPRAQDLRSWAIANM